MNPNTMNVQQIDIANIDDPTWNSRVVQDEEKDTALAESIRVEGILEPPKVRQLANGRYILVFGTRRLKAARALKLGKIPCIVDPPRPDADISVGPQSMLENSIENLQRKDLTPYEVARTLAALRDAKFKLDDIANKTGITKGHVSNLVTIYLKVDETILTEWRNANPVATVSFLRTLANTDDKAVQRKSWSEAVEMQRPASGADDIDAEAEAQAEADAAEAAEEAVTPPSAPAVEKYHIAKSKYTKLIRLLSAKKAPTLAVAVAKYLVGVKDSIPGFVDAPKKEE